MLWQGRMPRASGDRPVLNRRVTPVAPPLLIHQRNLAPNLTTRSYSCGAEEAGMKGWRGRAADVFTDQGEIAAKKKSALGPGLVGLYPHFGYGIIRTAKSLNK